MIGLSSFISCACEADRSLCKRSPMATTCRLMASLLGLIMVLNPSGFPCLLLPVWVFPTGNWRMVSGSQGALRLPSPLRTARDYFSVMQLKPFVRPLRDAVSPLLTVGCGLACDSWGEARPDCRRYPSLRSPSTPDDDCAIL